MEMFFKLLNSTSYPVIFFVGMGIRLIVGMRQFNRRGLGGLQHFNNYFVGLITLTVEWVLKWVGYVLMLWGLWKWVFG